ncbi:MAG TPA: uridine kinase [Firmicutes bacterium]|nr:uridine kinase [Bacillota bacterium]
MEKQCMIIGIAGGTGSGKTTVAKRILRTLDHEQVKIIAHDSYYLDRSGIPPEEREALNYDHPDAFDKLLFHRHLEEIARGRPIECPLYDYSTHTRRRETVHIAPCQVLIVEGILVLQDEAAREMMDVKLYVETDADVRLARRLRRDVKERSRSLESVMQQYFEVVRPMHLQFVEPSKKYADLIIPEGGFNEVAIDILCSKITRLLHPA